nr:DDE-type integrase/transposase/recombinase [Endozoicomonas sp. YOMI1]
MRSPVRGQFYYLYLVIDIYSRMIVVWKIHENEFAEHASQMITKACLRHGIAALERPLVLHSDNGSAMKGGTMLSTLQRLGVVSSFSRPRVSDDNPFAEVIFRTLKCQAEQYQFDNHSNQTLLELNTPGDYSSLPDRDDDTAEYLVPVEWKYTVQADQAFRETGLFGNQNTVCRPLTPKWRHTVERLKQVWKMRLMQISLRTISGLLQRSISIFIVVFIASKSSIVVIIVRRLFLTARIINSSGI